MESFKQLKRRTTDLLNSLPQSLPAIKVGGGGGASGPKGTWERIAVPPLPRSSHSLDVVSGTAYIFGGEGSDPRRPVDNAMHIVTLPYSSGAGADYHAVPAAPARPDNKTVELIPDQPAAAKEGDGEKPRELVDMQEVPLSPPPVEAGAPSSSPPALITAAGTEISVPDVPGDENVAETGPSAEEKGKAVAIASEEKLPLGDVPTPRVGHATAAIGHRIFLFGGRGGPDMTPLDESGRVWVFDTRAHAWSYLDPASPAGAGAGLTNTKPVVPAPRSYHCACATDKPRDFPPRRQRKQQQQPTTQGFAKPRRADSWKQWAEGDSREVGIPQAPIVGRVAAEAVDEDDEGYGTFFIHGGCLADGKGRAADLWAFDVRSRVWAELPAAPAPPRGGAAICVSKTRLFRFGGFDGTGEVGGQVDFLHLEVEMFDDGTAKGEVGVKARGGWQSVVQGRQRPVELGDRPVAVAGTGAPGETAGAAGDGTEYAGAAAAKKGEERESLVADEEWPAPRSVAGLEALTVGGGREYLVLVMGEVSPSGSGHAAAGRFADDVWVFQVPPLGMSTASVRDAILQAVGRPTGEGRWRRVEMSPHDDETDDSMPAPRGWIATAPMGDLEENAIVVWGGLSAENERLGDGWILRLL